MKRSMSWQGLSLMGCLLISTCVSIKRPVPDPMGQVSIHIRHLLHGRSGPDHRDTPRDRYRQSMLVRFYGSRDDRPAWVGPRGVLSQADQLIQAVEAGAGVGLPGELYRLVELREAVEASRGPRDAEHLARVDLALSETFIVYADHIRRGLVDPRTVNEHWHVPDRRTDLAGLLTTSLSLQNVGPALGRLQPRRSVYSELGRFLRQSSDLRRNKLEANLERWRWLPRDLGSDYLLVRLAAFELDWIRAGVQQPTRRVIVGTPFQRTPSFASQITDIVVHPFWHVPASIAQHELVPRMSRNPDFARAAGFRVLRDGRPAELMNVDWGDSLQTRRLLFVQAPGGGNPLGSVKFNLPNPFSIFLHDTPVKSHFTDQERDLSHGCVRVEGAIELARQILGSRAPLFDSLLANHQTGAVSLGRPLPVFFIYWTVDVVDGELRDLEDVYDEDSALINALQTVSRTPHTRGWLDSDRRPSHLRPSQDGGT
ncbi:MAG: L,D-transpeptidase family protein [Candidatus Latescibacterota bacterium]|nr:L,D-transpeptidase family protein [Candidatus Latescibacterota bacterium]